MIKSTCVPSCAFSLIYWVSINQSGHIIYQKKAKYHSYLRVSIILLSVKEFKIHVLNSTKISIVSLHIFECR